MDDDARPPRPATPDPAEDDASPPPPPPDVPVAGAERLASLDVLRGVAVLGILLVNAWTFALPFPAAMNPGLEGFDTGADRIVYALVHLLAYTKMMPVFGMLFGAGILLFTARVEARGGRSGRRWSARQAWLLVIGLVHGYVLWNGDILVPYAVVGLILYPLRRRRPRTLVILALVAMLVPKLTMTGFSYVWEYARDQAREAQAVVDAGGEPDAEQERFREIWTDTGTSWDPDAEQMAEITARMRGGYGGIVRHAARELFMSHLLMYPLTFGWNIAGFMLLGMALYRTGVLKAERTDRFYAVMAALAYGLGLPGAWLGMRFYDHHFDDFVAMMRGGFAIVEVTGPLVALGHVALVMLAVRRGWLRALQTRLAAAGRMAFSNYLGQSLLGVAVFYGYGLAQFGAWSRPALLGFTVAVWVLQLAVSPWWLARFRFGPAEWLWRSLAYGRRQPWRRAA